MNITVITPPLFEPVTLTEVYKQLRLTPDHEGSPGEETHPNDTQLAAMIQTSREHVEAMARRSLVQQTVRLSLRSFPVSYDTWVASYSDRRALVQTVRLFRPPVIRVEAVRYYDGDNLLQTVDAASYYVTDDAVPELRFISGFSQPTVYDRPDAVRVEYVAGYAPSNSPSSTQADYIGNVPRALRDAILIGVQLLHDDMAPQDREALEKMQERLVQPLRVQLAL